MEITQEVSVNNTLNFIKERFRDYYEKKGVTAPPEIEKREFGFGNEKKIDYRHYTFKTEEQLKRHFVENAPLYGSFSAAYYEFPSARPMVKKNYLGADLIFDIDAQCKKDCNLTCTVHLEEAKANATRLIEDFLITDFGFDRKEIVPIFSGSKGYHVHVRSEEARKLSPEARKEMVDYLRPTEADVERIIKMSPKPTDAGWKGRFARVVYENVKESKEKKFADKPHILEQIKRGNFDLTTGPVSYFKKMLESSRINFGSDIDRMVTLDIHKIIRIPSTIHGGSSLLCMNVVNLDKFNPFRDSIVFHNPPVKVRIKGNVLPFTLNEQTFGPLESEKEIELPEYAALFLICKGSAVIA